MILHGRTRTLIVDDDKEGVSKLQGLLAAEHDVEIVGSSANGTDAVRKIRSLDPDLVFLDAELPLLSGFQVIQHVGLQEMPVTIFVTENDEFALRAFDAQAADFLLKPFDHPRFTTALDRARSLIRLRQQHGLEQTLDHLLQTYSRAPLYPDRFLVKSGTRWDVVRPHEIDWIEAADNYVTLHIGTRNVLHRNTMKSLEGRLDPMQFVRIRHSVIVNVARINRVHQWSSNGYQVVLNDGTELLSTRSYKDRIRAFFL
jgi:two-component system, LytTR family, response regulator